MRCSKSARLSAVACTATSASSGPKGGSGSSRTLKTSGPPGSVITAARIVSPAPPSRHPSGRREGRGYDAPPPWSRRTVYSGKRAGEAAGRYLGRRGGVMGWHADPAAPSATLARFVAEASVPEAVRRTARRYLLDWLGSDARGRRAGAATHRAGRRRGARRRAAGHGAGERPAEFGAARGARERRRVARAGDGRPRSRLDLAPGRSRDRRGARRRRAGRRLRRGVARRDRDRLRGDDPGRRGAGGRRTTSTGT